MSLSPSYAGMLTDDDNGSPSTSNQGCWESEGISPVMFSLILLHHWFLVFPSPLFLDVPWTWELYGWALHRPSLCINSSTAEKLVWGLGAALICVFRGGLIVCPFSNITVAKPYHTWGLELWSHEFLAKLRVAGKSFCGTGLESNLKKWGEGRKR